MNKLVMFIWGAVIVLLCTLLFLIGYKEKDLDYIRYENLLKTATKAYVNNKGLNKDSQIVFVEELVEANYITETEENKKYCIESIVYSEGLIKDNYVINKNCKDKE